VLHAGTEFEVALTVTDTDITVSVTDRGPGPLELHLAQPRQRYGRAASHGRGLALVQRLASTWGTRHETDGRHVIWFSLARADRPPSGGAAAHRRAAARGAAGHAPHRRDGHRRPGAHPRPHRADRLPRGHGRGVAVAARGRPASTVLDDLPGRDQRAARAVAR